MAELGWEEEEELGVLDVCNLFLRIRKKKLEYEGCID